MVAVVRKLSIEPEAELILILRLVVDALIVVRHAAAGRQRVPRKQRHRNRVHAVGRDDTTWELRANTACCRRRVINDWHTTTDGFREAALLLQKRWHGGDDRAADRLALALVVEEEERAVLLQRTTSTPVPKSCPKPLI